MLSGKHAEAYVHFVVTPINRYPNEGFWVDAADPEEARRLVSLNVAGMEQAVSHAFAFCEPDQTYTPPFGVIFEGSGRTYTVEKR